jgi:molybdate transport system substrate-binding protein
MVFVGVICLAPIAYAQAPGTVTVFAAASLTNAITVLGNMFNAKGAGNATASFAASSALAKQIENGAPADVFISADEAWMNYLSEKRLIAPDSRFDLLGNKLVFVAPLDSNLKLDVRAGFQLPQVLAEGRLATGDPDHVPVGKYAKKALENLGIWAGVEARLARGDNVRAALALVERGECPLGIVYSTDAAISRKVKIVGIFPQDSYPPITYPAALVIGKDTEAARNFLNFLRTPDAKAVFEKYGFVVR